MIFRNSFSSRQDHLSQPLFFDRPLPFQEKIIIGSIITLRPIFQVDRYRAVLFCAHMRRFLYILCYIGIDIARYNNTMLYR